MFSSISRKLISNSRLVPEVAFSRYKKMGEKKGKGKGVPYFDEKMDWHTRYGVKMKLVLTNHHIKN